MTTRDITKKGNKLKPLGVDDPIISSDFSTMDVRFQHPCTMYVAGPTQSGKSHFISKCLQAQDQVFDHCFDRVLWAHGHTQPLHDEMIKTVPNLTITEGLPQDLGDPDFFDPMQNNCLIIDDLLDQATKDPRVMNLFTVGSHHSNLTVIFLTQNVFHGGRGNRTMSLNVHYIVCFSNPRDRCQITHLGRQMFPGQSTFVQSAFAQATKSPFGYLVFDCKPMCFENYRVRSGILPQETSHAYVPKL